MNACLDIYILFVKPDHLLSDYSDRYTTLHSLHVLVPNTIDMYSMFVVNIAMFDLYNLFHAYTEGNKAW